MKTMEQVMMNRPAAITPLHTEKTAVVYVRLGTRPTCEAEEAAIEAQRAQAKFARRWGWPAESILLIEDDIGQSSTITPRRTGFRQLCQMIEAGLVGLVLVSDFSRLSRSWADLSDFLVVCQATNTLVAVDGWLAHGSDAAGNFVLRLRSLLHECERACLALADAQQFALGGWKVVPPTHPSTLYLRESRPRPVGRSAGSVMSQQEFFEIFRQIEEEFTQRKFETPREGTER